VSVLGCVLEQLFSNPSDTLPSDPACISMFHTERIPSIGIGAYLERVAHYAECSEEALVMSFIHISRIYHANQSAAAQMAAGVPLPPGAPRPFHLNTLSIHRLLLVSILCSSKFFDDFYYNNSHYAKIGGVALKELNVLEVEFLALVAFDLHIPAKIFKRFHRELTNAQLHPYCQCDFRHLPPAEFDDELPFSPAHDADLHSLMYGQPAEAETSIDAAFPDAQAATAASASAAAAAAPAPAPSPSLEQPAYMRQGSDTSVFSASSYGSEPLDADALSSSTAALSAAFSGQLAVDSAHLHSSEAKVPDHDAE